MKQQVETCWFLPHLCSKLNLGKNRDLRSDIILQGRRSARSEWSRVWRAEPSSGGNANEGERCDCCYHGMELPPEILEAGSQSLHSDQTEGVRWENAFHNVRNVLLVVSSGCSTETPYVLINPGRPEQWPSLCSTSTLVVSAGGTQTVSGCDNSRIFQQRCAGLAGSRRPGTSLHNAVLILNNVASKAFSWDQRSGATTLRHVSQVDISQ